MMSEVLGAEPKTRNISAGMNIISQCPRGKKLPSNVDLTLESHTVIIFYILNCIYTGVWKHDFGFSEFRLFHMIRDTEIFNLRYILGGSTERI